MVGMRDRTALLTMQRALNEYRKEPLLAIIPGVALKQLWDLIGIADRALMVVAAFVVFAGPARHAHHDSGEPERTAARNGHPAFGGRRAAPYLHAHVAEAGILATAGVLAGIGITYALLAAAQPLLAARYGIFVPLTGLNGVRCHHARGYSPGGARHGPPPRLARLSQHAGRRPNYPGMTCV